MKTLLALILLSIYACVHCKLSIKRKSDLLNELADEVTKKVLSDLEQKPKSKGDKEEKDRDDDDDDGDDDNDGDNGDDDEDELIENDEDEDLPKGQKSDPLFIPPIRIPKINVDHPRPNNCHIHRDQCGRFANGCGPQFYAEHFGGRNILPHESVFTPACNKHDSCFTCANEKGWTQKQCDDRFLHDMKKKCKCRYYKWYDTLKRGDCIAWAAAFYGAVRVGGHKYFDTHRISQSCYRQCMIPLASPHVEVTE